MTNTAFTTPLPLLPASLKLGRCTRQSPSRFICPTPLSIRTRSANVQLRMSLTSELLTKGLEVFAATYLSRAAVTTATGGNNSNSKSTGIPDFSRHLSTLPHGEDIISFLQSLSSLSHKRWTKLAICLGIDLVGSGSLPVPFLADALDIVTAPLSALMLHALFANPLVTAIGFAEEILPGTDGIPTATLAWLAEHYRAIPVPPTAASPASASENSVSNEANDFADNIFDATARQVVDEDPPLQRRRSRRREKTAQR